MSLKTDLQAMNKGDTLNVQGVDVSSLIDQMLDQISSVDPELRDILIYNTFGRLLDSKSNGIHIDGLS